MNVTGCVWLELTREERMIVLEFAVFENRKNRLKRKAATA